MSAECRFPGIGFEKMLLNASRLADDGAGGNKVLLAIEDVSGK